ncbi:ADP-ribosylglycohydrolase family protein [Steroidobacter flavus]|uniref:ADP-ribosylglycohydrolase family protein n=1 Tax=Steroidobacter flavus TaxID=1842136 RepID=A0ABV8SWR9_9GAMM
MIGAIAGDIIGSVYEADPIKTKSFPLFHPSCEFTDDTVLTIAIASSILTGESYLSSVRKFARRHPDAGYGQTFYQWMRRPEREPQPYNSWGNGSAMRVSPVGFAFSDEDEVLRQARMTAEITHNHPEGIKGAEATALAVFLARTQRDKSLIRDRIIRSFGYDLNRTLDEIRPSYSFDVSCQGTVPEAIIAFLESDSYEDAIRNAISLGGDSDTLACITGGIAEAFYGGVPQPIMNKAEQELTEDLREVVAAFRAKYL